jgi:phage tail-like protein
VSAVDRDPYSANNFEVDLGDGPVGFAAVSGLGYEIAYADDATGDPRRAQTGRVTAQVAEVSLKRGVTGDQSVWTWVRSAVDGKVEPRTVTIRLLDARQQPVCAWVLRGARPTKWFGPALTATGTSVAIEELVLTADSIEFNAAGD